MYKVRQAYGYDAQAASKRSNVSITGPSLAVQSQKDDADINVIVKRFGVTGEVPVTNKMPTYQDFEGVFDFRTAHEAVMAGREAFMQVPAGIRAQFHNDPQAFTEFCVKPENYEMLKQWGLTKLVEEPKVPEPQRVVIVSENSDGSGSEGTGKQAGKAGKRDKGGTADGER